MVRLRQIQNKNYIRSATTDKQQVNNDYIQNLSRKRVKHPTDQSFIVNFIKYSLIFCLKLLISIPCVILITLILPICWFTRSFLKIFCRYHCRITPCSCSYLSPSDLFWLYNTNKEKNQLKSQPMAAAIFFLEGKIFDFSLLTFFIYIYM